MADYAPRTVAWRDLTGPALLLALDPAAVPMHDEARFHAREPTIDHQLLAAVRGPGGRRDHLGDEARRVLDVGVFFRDAARTSLRRARKPAMQRM